MKNDDIIKITSRKKTFPQFWFESSFYFNAVRNREELRKMILLHHRENIPPEKILLARNYLQNNKADFANYGLRIAYEGTRTLEKFLNENGINIEIYV